MRFVIEHGRTGKRPAAQLVIKVYVLSILGKIIEPVIHFPVLFHRKGQRNVFNIIFDNKIMIKIAGRIRR